jgi:thiaminase (transcriptional activator TenA)
MTPAIDPFNNPETLFGKLRAACPQQWDAYCQHEFVCQLGSGTLPERCFRHYLEQDYIFLIHFSRAWALAVYKSDNLADMQAASATLNTTLNYEMELHVKYCQQWGVSREQMEKTEEARANMAYTRYVLERGLAGDILDLHVALSPCVVGYAVIGRDLACAPGTKLEGNPYREWIEAYSDEEYQESALAAIKQIDALAASRIGTGRLESLFKTFYQATVLEIGFWEMGLKIQT